MRRPMEYRLELHKPDFAPRPPALQKHRYWDLGRRLGHCYQILDFADLEERHRRTGFQSTGYNSDKRRRNE